MINFDHSSNNISASSGNITINGVLPLPSSAILASIGTLPSNINGIIKITNGAAAFESISNLTLDDSGVTPGTYKSVTVNAKGIVTSASNPTTLTAYGITDAVSSIDTTWVMFNSSGNPTVTPGNGATITGGVNSVNSKIGAVTITKGDLNLSNVDDTSDLSKPLSAAAIAALAQKQGLLINGVTIKTINGQSILGAGNLVVEGSGGSSTGGSLVNFGDVTDTPTTLLGYGIVDSAPLSHVTDTNLHLTASQRTLLSNLASQSTVIGYLTGVTSPLQPQLDSKQPTIVSGTHVKTVNGKSIVGSGDVYVSGGLQATSIKTTNYTASANDLVRVDGSNYDVDVTFPSNVSDGTIIGVVDVANSFGVNNTVRVVTTSPITIEDEPDLVLDVVGSYTSFIFNASSGNWKLLDMPAAVTGTVPDTIVNPYVGAITSVAGRVGDVVISKSDVGLSNVLNIPQLPSSQTLVITGDVTASSTQLQSGTINTTLTNSGVVPGTYNNSTTSIQPFTVDAKGRITSVGSPANIRLTYDSLLNKPTTLAEFGIISTGSGALVSATAPTIHNLQLTGTLTVGMPSTPNTWLLNSNLTVTGNYTVSLPAVTLANALPVSSGGTGLVSPGSSGNVLTSNGSIWESKAPTVSSSSSSFPVLTPLSNVTIDLSTYFPSITWGSTNTQSYGWLIQRTAGVAAGVSQFALISGGYRAIVNGGCIGSMLPFQVNADGTCTVGTATTMWTNSSSPYDFSTCSIITDNKSGMFHYSGNIPWPGNGGHVMGYGWGRLNANNTGGSFGNTGTTTTDGIHDHNGQYFGLPDSDGIGWRGVNAGYSQSDSKTRIHQIEFVNDGSFTINVQNPSSNTSTSPIMQLYLGPNSNTSNTAISGISHWRNSSNYIVARVFAGSSTTYTDYVSSTDWGTEYSSGQFPGFALSDGSVLVFHTTTNVYRYTAHNSRVRVYPTPSPGVGNIFVGSGSGFPISNPDWTGATTIPDGDNQWLFVDASAGILKRLYINPSTFVYTITSIATVVTAGATSYMKLNALPNNRIMVSMRSSTYNIYQYMTFTRPA